MGPSLSYVCAGSYRGKRNCFGTIFLGHPIKVVQKGRVRPWYCVLQSVQKSTNKYPGSTVRSKVPRRPQPFPPQNLHCLLLPGYLDGGTLWLFIFIRAYSFIHRVRAWKDAVSRCPAHAHQIFPALPPPKIYLADPSTQPRIVKVKMDHSEMKPRLILTVLVNWNLMKRQRFWRKNKPI